MHYPPRSTNRKERAARARTTANRVPCRPAPPPLPEPPSWHAMPATPATPAVPVNRDKSQPRFDPVTAIGEVILLLGIFVAAFTLWNLYVTDLQAERQTAQAVEDFKAPCPDITSLDERTSPPPEIGEVTEGEVFATMHVPAWRYMTIPIKEGTSQAVLNTGAAGHYLNTAMPGQVGNFSVAGHRRTYGSNFRRVDILKPGDPIIVETKSAWIIYKVESTRIVSPKNLEVIKPNPIDDSKPSQAYLTMTTCHPEYGNSERFIVHNIFDHWVPKETGIPKELAGKNPCSN